MLMNARTSDVVASAIEIAATRAARRRGLLGRHSLDPAAALILSPCCSIHTIGMQFPIDAMFINRDGIVVKIVRDLTPWRLAVSWRAHAVIEFAGGTLDTRDVRVGDRVYVAPEPAAPDAAMTRPVPA
jgi:hypothetical protein